MNPSINKKRPCQADALLFGVLTASLLGVRFYWLLKKKQGDSSKSKA